MPEGVGYSNKQVIAAPSKDIAYIGGKTWAGWSGNGVTTSGTDAILYDFKSPNRGLKAIASFSFQENNLSANKLIGLVINLNGNDMYKMIIKKSSDAGFTNLDSDQIGFVIPPLTTVLITTTTDDTDNIATYLNLVCEEV